MLGVYTKPPGDAHLQMMRLCAAALCERLKVPVDGFEQKAKVANFFFFF